MNENEEDWEPILDDEPREDIVESTNNLAQPNKRTKLILAYMVSTVALFCALLSLYEGFNRLAVLSIIVSLSVALVTYLWSKKHNKN